MAPSLPPILLTTISILLSSTSAQNSSSPPLTSNCHSSSSVLCINKYFSVLPYPFSRPAANTTVDTVSLNAISFSDNSTTDALNSASFLVFEEARGLEILGPDPTYDFVFRVSEAVHEAPVYWEAGEKLFLSELAPPPGYLPQLVIDLKADPPTLSEFLSEPPVYAPNGGTWHADRVYWAASGGNKSIGGGEQRPGIRTLDPATNKTETLLNSYFGYFFNCVDDLVVDGKGDVWFTDPFYSWYNALTDTPPQLMAATYRFRPSTGAVYVVEDTLAEPNGIAIAPGGQTVYISDTGAVTGTIDPRFPDIHGVTFNQTGRRTIYKFDVADLGQSLINKRPIYLSQDWVPDGLKVAANGLVVTGAGRGVDILDEFGTLLVRIQTNYTVQNFEWVKDKNTGRRTELWMMGNGGISRARFNLEGQTLR